MEVLWPFIWLESRLVEVDSWVAALEPHIEELQPRDQANALHVIAFLAFEAGDFETARASSRLGIEIARQIGNEELGALGHLVLGRTLAAFDLEDPDIQDHLVAAIGVFREREEEMYLVYALLILSSWEAARGNFAVAQKGRRVHGSNAANREARAGGTRIVLARLPGPARRRY
jgi:hypothetical protein